MQRVYFGEGAHGLASAADTYFGKDVSELTLSEAAMLARCVRRPSSENPFKDFDRAIQNRNVVLSIMLQDGQIDSQQYDEALAEKPKLNTGSTGILAMKPRCPFFVDDVLRRLKVDFPDLDLRGGGYKSRRSDPVRSRWRELRAVAVERGDTIQAAAGFVVQADRLCDGPGDRCSSTQSVDIQRADPQERSQSTWRLLGPEK